MYNIYIYAYIKHTVRDLKKKTGIQSTNVQTCQARSKIHKNSNYNLNWSAVLVLNHGRDAPGFLAASPYKAQLFDGLP